MAAGAGMVPTEGKKWADSRPVLKEEQQDLLVETGLVLKPSGRACVRNEREDGC